MTELAADWEEGHKHTNVVTSRENETCCKHDDGTNTKFDEVHSVNT